MTKDKTTGTITLQNLFTIVILILVIISNCFSQQKTSIIDTLMHRLAARNQFNGSVLVAENGKVIYKGGFGMADREQNVAFTPSTPCYLASLTKQFTAMAVMMLMEQHKLSYSDLLSKYFPEFPPYAQTITIRHLLNHTSGIP